MRLRLLLCICAIWLQLCISAPIADPISEKILPLTRVLAAVTIQHEICRNENSAVAIVGELINVDKTHLNQFLQLKATNQSKHISDISTFIDKIPSIDAQEIQKTFNGLDALSKLKEKESIFSVESLKYPSDQFNTSAYLRHKFLAIDSSGINIWYFDNVFSYLKKIEAIESKSATPVELNELHSMKYDVQNTNIAVGNIKNHRTAYAEYFSFEGFSSRMDKYLDVFLTIKEVAEHFEDLKKFDSTVSVLTKQSSILQAEKSKFENYKQFINEAKNRLEQTKLLLSGSAEKAFTIGLSTGIIDMKKVQIDIESKVFQEVAARGKSIKSLQESLEPFSNTSNNLDVVVTNLKKMEFDSQVLKDYDEYIALFSDVVAASKHATENNDVAKKLQGLIPCVNLLQKDDKLPNFYDLQSIIRNIEQITEKVYAFKLIMEQITNHKGFDGFVLDYESLRALLDKLPDYTTSDQLGVAWTEIRNMNIANKHQAMFDLIQKIDREPFFIGSAYPSVNLLPAIVTSANNMKLFDAVKCLPTTSPDNHSLIDTGRKIDALKPQKSKLTAVDPILTNSQEFQLSVNEAIAELKKAKSEDVTHMICDLPKKFGQNLRSFINGGALAADVLMIKNSEKSIKAVAKPNSSVKVAAEAVPKADTIYHDSFRKEILELLQKVKSQLKIVESMPTKSLDDIIGILKRLTQIEGYAPKNFKLIREIAKELSQNSNQEVNSAAKDFQTVSNLHMDFAAYSSSDMQKDDIEDAIQMLFFVDSDALGSSLFGSSQGIIVFVCFIVLAVLLIGIICFTFYKAGKQNGTN